MPQLSAAAQRLWFAAVNPDGAADVSENHAGADTLLGPEMRSTGEVMGIDESFSAAYAKAALAAGQRLPMSGKVFITMIDKYKQAIVPIAKVSASPRTSCVRMRCSQEATRRSLSVKEAVHTPV